MPIDLFVSGRMIVSCEPGEKTLPYVVSTSAIDTAGMPPTRERTIIITRPRTISVKNSELAFEDFDEAAFRRNYRPQCIERSGLLLEWFGWSHRWSESIYQDLCS
jgi:hypothetical protein